MKNDWISVKNLTEAESKDCGGAHYHCLVTLSRQPREQT